MATFKTILCDIEIFCNQHFQINEFGWGPISNISTKNHNFIMVWMLPTSARKQHSSTFINYDMYVFDILKQDGSNKIDVMNDTFMVGTDIISEFFDNESEYGFVMSEIANAEPFDFQFDDFCGGWVFKIEIEYENSLNTCNIPTEYEEVITNLIYEGVLTSENNNGYRLGLYGSLNPASTKLVNFYRNSTLPRYLYITIIPEPGETRTDIYVEIDGAPVIFNYLNVIGEYRSASSYSVNNPLTTGNHNILIEYV